MLYVIDDLIKSNWRSIDQSAAWISVLTKVNSILFKVKSILSEVNRIGPR